MSKGPNTNSADIKDALPTPVIKHAGALSQNTLNGLWGMSTGKLEIYFSKSWFTAGSLDKNSCTVSWQTSRPSELPISNGGPLTSVASTSASPGFFKSYFHFSDSNGTTFSAFPTDPSNSSYVNSASQELRNYFIRKTTIDSNLTELPISSTKPATVKIVSVLQNIG
ncbi:MAG: hypothetical protein GY861_26030, partial [bacterium]|nr:hypothetical protein [bacterium]